LLRLPPGLPAVRVSLRDRQHAGADPVAHADRRGAILRCGASDAVPDRGRLAGARTLDRADARPRRRLLRARGAEHPQAAGLTGAIAVLVRLVAQVRKEMLVVLRDPRSRAVLVGPPLVQLFVFAFAATLEVENVA